MARLTRKELKKDPFLSVYYDDFVEFAQKHYSKIIIAILIIAAVVAADLYRKRYRQHQELAANTMLGTALATFHAYVGQAGALAPGAQTFADGNAKYEAALKQFTAVYAKYPGEKAGELALYHIGLCQAELGQHGTAIQTLRKAGQDTSPDVAALARFALAGELAKSGKTAEAEKAYRDLAEHPTATVPSATAWLALAGLEQTANPSAARDIYTKLLKDHSGDTELVAAVKEHLAGMSE